MAVTDRYADSIAFGEPRSLHYAPPIPTRTSSLAHLTQTNIYAQRRLDTRVSPGYRARSRRLDEQRRRYHEQQRRQERIGRISEERPEDLELWQQVGGVVVQRQKFSWTGVAVKVMPRAPRGLGGGGGGGVRLSGGPALSETEMSSSVLESDINSSPISLGTRLVASDSEDELADTHKYRMPDVGKTRLHLHTKVPMSPTPRHTRTSPRQSWHETPATPRSARRSTTSPVMNASPQALGRRNGSSENVSDSDWVGSGLSRAGSIYSLSRVSFTGQLSQLTSMRLPDANSLAKRISSIPTSTEAARALADASDQIMMWIGKASEVLSGLDSEDDVEWAAAGGRDGIEDVDTAIARFERLVQVYIVSIERLQTRKDVVLLTTGELMGSVKQLESVIVAWHKIKETLKGIKEQVEVAMEWEELWNTVLGEIGQEMDGLNRLVFEMEEKRHQGAESILTNRDSIDLNELETIVEEQPGRGKKANNRFSIPPPFSPSSPLQPSESAENKDDSSLLALFARMQPLRASLDFLPMRLSAFHVRGNAVFPTACEDLEQRRDTLEASWKKLENDAESLRCELGEDRWVLVFRNAGKQALKMCESVSRSFGKLREGIDSGEQQFNMPLLSKKIENYEAKKLHYGPAIERVLAIIDKGVLDRLTVNGEILRLQSDMKRRWSTLQADMRDMDVVLEDVTNDAREKQLRDSVSTVMSSERSMASSMMDGTPGSSPASSVVGTSRKSSFQGSRTPTPLISGKMRPSQFTPGSDSRSGTRLLSSSSIPRRTPLTRAATADIRTSPSPSPCVSITPPSASSNYPPRRSDNRPRWSSAAKVESRDFAPLSKFEPSPYAKTPVQPRPYIPRFSTSATPSASGRRTPLATRNFSEPLQPSALPKTSIPLLELPQRKSSLPVPSTPSARPGSAFATRRPPSSLRVSSFTVPNGRRSSMLPTTPGALYSDGNEADSESPSTLRRPPSALEKSGRRSSMLPMRSASRFGESIGAGGQVVARDKPRWR